MTPQRSSAPVAIITGAARGLGADTARELVLKGWCVLLTDVCSDNPAIPYSLATRDEMEATVEACRELAGKSELVMGMVADVRRQDDLDEAVRSAVARFGRLDAAVAAAGVIAGGTPTWQIGEQTWRELFDVNVSGVWRLATAAVPALLAQPEPRQGRFVAVSSAAGLRGTPQLAAYSATKHGVIGLVRSMAAELGPSGITATVVCPGSMNTPMLKASAEVYGLPDVAEFAKHHLLERLLDSKEVARLIAWLCSAESSALTGAVLTADAGMTAS